MLKKQFEKKDVQRLRNLLQGKSGERSTIGIGYEIEKIEHKEGDIWEEDGRKWTIKNGIKQNITKFDKAKQEIILPLFCPCCNNLMNNKHDKLFYIQYKRCFNCQIDFETELKTKGLWETYEKHILNSDLDGLTKQYSEWIDELINTSDKSFITEDGVIENWVGGDSKKKKLLEDKEETIKYLQSLKK